MDGHRCPAPDCDVQVPPGQYACRAHWYSLPRPLRDAIWDGYRTEPLGDAHITAMENAASYLASRKAGGHEDSRA
jgi:hypothetical protein